MTVDLPRPRFPHNKNAQRRDPEAWSPSSRGPALQMETYSSWQLRPNSSPRWGHICGQGTSKSLVRADVWLVGWQESQSLCTLETTTPCLRAPSELRTEGQRPKRQPSQLPWLPGSSTSACLLLYGGDILMTLKEIFLFHRKNLHPHFLIL